MKFKEEKREYIILSICTLIFCFLNIGSSPLIHANSSDSALFMTMGRAMLSGKVLFRDIFDHKGLYIFLINAIAVLIGKDSLNGLFLVESITIFIDTFLVYRISRLFQKEQESLFTALLFTALGMNYFLFVGGNRVEEYCLPFQLISIYLFCRYLRQKGKSAHPAELMFIHGICGGFCFWIRATDVMMWIPLAILITGREFAQKRNKNAWKNIGYGAAGLLIISIPVFLYGYINHCMEEMFYAAFTFNIQYTKAQSSGLFLNILKTLFKDCEIILMLLCAVSIVLVQKRTASRFARAAFCLMFLFSFLAAAVSGRTYWHYYTCLLPYTLPALSKIASFICQTPRLRRIGILLIMGCGIFFGAVFPARFMAVCFGQKLTLVEKNRNDYEACAKIKNEYYPLSNKVLVTGGNAQFYEEMKVVPELKYPFILSMSYEDFPDTYEEQLGSIISAIDDVVVLPNKGYDPKHIVPVYDGLYEKEVETALEQYYRLVYYGETTGNRMYVRK